MVGEHLLEELGRFDGDAEILQAWRDGMAPEPALLVSEWADKHRVLGSRGSAEPGPWRTVRPPYLREIMDALSPAHPAAPFLDIVTVQGQAVVPVDLVNIGHWLRLLPGAPTTTGTSPNFSHTFGSGAAALPSNSIEIGFPDMPSCDVCTGVRADTLEIDFSPSGPATASFDLMGQGSTRGGVSSGGTPVSATDTAFNKAQGSISRVGSALAQVTGASKASIPASPAARGRSRCGSRTRRC